MIIQNYKRNNVKSTYMFTYTGNDCKFWQEQKDRMPCVKLEYSSKSQYGKQLLTIST